MVRISLRPSLPADELMARHFVHGAEQALVMDATPAQLLLHHGKPLSREGLCSVSVHLSLLPPANAYIEPEHAVLVPHGYDGDILVNVVFHLDHRLRRLREAGAVSESNVVVDGLLNGDARAWVIFRADELRINRNAAAAEEPLHPVRERGV